MATITSTTTRITISGVYKAFVGSAASTTTSIERTSGNSPASGDAGRFLLWKNTANTNNWEIRFITSASGSTVNVGDGGFSSAPPAGADFVISNNLDDLVAALGDTVIRKDGRSYQMIGRDFSLSNGAFLGDVGKALSATGTSPGSFNGTFPIATGCAMQWGRLIGGEANDSVETIGGCQLNLEVINNNSLVFTEDTRALTDGPVFNFYGCHVASLSAYLPFIRASGPMRMIGCVFDGPLGGRLYSTASELADSRFSGNVSGGVAWSLGGSFVRPIDNTFFFQNNTAVKAYQDWEGTFSNTTFAGSNSKILDNNGAGSNLLFKFIDCTTFDDTAYSSNRGNYEQFKSINYTTADSVGIGLSGVNVGVYDNTGLVQDGVQTSTSGTVPIINARFYRRDHQSPGVSKSPFDIRVRKYGLQYVEISSEVSEPIKQELRLPVDEGLTYTEAEVSVLPGISMNFTTRTVTITADTDTNKLNDYYLYQLALTGNLQYANEWVRSGDLLDIGSWNMIVDGASYSGDVTTTGLIELINGGQFLGIRTDQDGTVKPPIVVDISGVIPGSRIQVYNITTATETINELEPDGVAYALQDREASDYSPGDIIRLRVTKLGEKEWIGVTFVGAVGFSFLVSQETDAVYASIGIDGSTVTKFNADYSESDVNLSLATDWGMGELYAWWMYNLTTEEGIRNYFGGITAIDLANFRINSSIVDLYLDNSVSASFKQTDNRRFFRDTGDGYPVKEPTTSGYGLDVVWRSTVLIAESNVSGLTPAESAQLNKAATNSGLIPGLF